MANKNDATDDGRIQRAWPRDRERQVDLMNELHLLAAKLGTVVVGIRSLLCSRESLCLEVRRLRQEEAFGRGRL